MMPDQGYDILPLYSAEFLKGDKLGFGLQQNVYMDLPLYGATEYIYMVDKRNGDGSQSDVRYDDNSGSANSGGFKSYKLGDTVKEAVSKSDKDWAQKQNQQASAQIAECDKILTPENKLKHDKDGEAIQGLLKSCENYTVQVNGVEIEDENGKIIKNPMMTEEEILAKVKECKQKDNDFEQLKKDIANWVNEELSKFQSRMTSIFNQNECVKTLMLMEGDTSKDPHRKTLIDRFTDKWVEKYLWKKNDDETYVNKCLKLYNEFETYAYTPTMRVAIVDVAIDIYNKDDGKSFLLEKTGGDGMVTVRPSMIESLYKDRLVKLDLMKENEKFNLDVKVQPLKEAPDWTREIPVRVEWWTGGKFPKQFCETVIVNPLCYKCEPKTSFDSFDSKVYKDNHEMLGRYETALESIRSKLYGDSADGACDKTNPAPESPYGKYLELKNKHENDEYAQAEKMKSIAQSGMVEIDSDMNNSEQNTTDESSNGIPSTNIQQTEEEPEPIITPQTVLDMLGFISGMRRMTTEYPYIIQSITGLDKAYENHYGVKDPYMGSGDNKIVLSCWESLDLRVTTMFNRYFNAVYDRQYRRERVPINLRRFNCSVYVHDVRNFVTNNSKGQYENRMLELTDMYYSAIEFKFYDCEIVPEETGNIFNDISNEAPTEMKKTNFTFTYGNCVVNFVPQSEVAKYR